MVQLAKCLSCKHKDQSSIPRTYVKNPTQPNQPKTKSQVLIHTCNPSTREAEAGRSCAYLVRSRLERDPVSNKTRYTRVLRENT